MTVIDSSEIFDSTFPSMTLLLLLLSIIQDCHSAFTTYKVSPKVVTNNATQVNTQLQRHVMFYNLQFMLRFFTSYKHIITVFLWRSPACSPFDKTRPNAPSQLAERIINFLIENVIRWLYSPNKQDFYQFEGELRACLDVIVCGNGQCSGIFASSFRKVLTQTIRSSRSTSVKDEEVEVLRSLWFCYHGCQPCTNRWPKRWNTLQTWNSSTLESNSTVSLWSGIISKIFLRAGLVQRRIVQLKMDRLSL